MKFEDNVIGLKFTNKDSEHNFIVFCIYLPPETSKYGRRNDKILNKIAVEVYWQCESEAIYICGDFNARIECKADCTCFDDISARSVIDETVNSQGNAVLEFLNDVRGCILNGCMTPEHNDFTSITSYRGRAVVDYHLMRQTDLATVRVMKVLSCVNLITKHGWEYLISGVCRIPDHNLLTMDIELFSY